MSAVLHPMPPDAAEPLPADTVDVPAPAWRAPFDTLDDDALLAHFRHRRGVRIEPVIDEAEVTAERLAGVRQGRFEFNGEAHHLPDPIDWLRNPSADVEWHILLHKFYYAVGLARQWQRDADETAVERWCTLVDGWMRVTPAGFIAADVTGRRVQNWIYGLQLLLAPRADGRFAALPPGLLRRVLASLHTQVEHLCANLTPKRNHRTLELLAIFLAGVMLPEFERSAHWRRFALAHTATNVESDLLPDGVHCELSTDYHCLALRNWMQVRRLAVDHGLAVPAAMDDALNRAYDFALQVHQPDGGMPSLSDGDARGFLPLLLLGADAFGREDLRFVATLGREGRAPTTRQAHFHDAGYHVLRSGWSADPSAPPQHLVFDCGPLGEGNHGHFDALSFELHAAGRPLVVDPGRGTYSEAGPVNWRVHFRGTAAHSTVCVDGLPQTRYEPKAVKAGTRHASGRVRHRIAGPAPQTVLLDSVDGGPLDLLHGRCASAAYDAVHERCLVFVDGCYWIVADWLRAPSVHDYVLRFQLGPQAQGRCRLDTADGARLHSPGLAMAQPARDGQACGLTPAWVSPRYGERLDAPALTTHARGHDADFDTVLLPWRGRAPSVAVADLAVLGDDGSVGRALQIDIADGPGALRDGWFHARGGRARRWTIGTMRFEGRWLHWRLDPQGGLRRAVSHPGARLAGPDGALPLHTGSLT